MAEQHLKISSFSPSTEQGAGFSSLFRPPLSRLSQRSTPRRFPSPAGSPIWLAVAFSLSPFLPRLLRGQPACPGRQRRERCSGATLEAARKWRQWLVVFRRSQATGAKGNTQAGGLVAGGSRGGEARRGEARAMQLQLQLQPMLAVPVVG